MSEPFRLGVVGTGIVAAEHVRAARSLHDVRITAVCDIRTDEARRLADTLHAAAYGEHRDMLANEQLDGVVITAPHALHAAMTRDAATAGVHVLVEKPMATSVADCTTMIEACEQAGVVLAVGHVVRFGRTAGKVAEALHGLGAVLAVDHRRTSHYRRGSRPDWFFDPVMAGGGIVMNVGIHALDRIQLLGGGPVVSASAKVWHRDGHAIETDAMGEVDLESGVTARFLLTSADLRYVDETLVVCERGALRWSGTDGLSVSRADGGETDLAVGKGDPFAAQLADFVAACRDGREPLVGGDYGRSVIAAVAAIYASAKTGFPERSVL